MADFMDPKVALEVRESFAELSQLPTGDALQVLAATHEAASALEDKNGAQEGAGPAPDTVLAAVKAGAWGI